MRSPLPFSRAVQAMTDNTGLEASADDLHALFRREYLERESPLRYVSHQLVSDSGAVEIEVQMLREGKPCSVRGKGALDLRVRVMDYHEHAMTAGADARAACYVEVRVGESPTGFGAGIDANLVTASLRAVLSGLNRHLQAGFGVAPARQSAHAIEA